MSIDKKHSPLDEAEQQEIRALVATYPHPKAAALDALLLMQAKHRYINDDVLAAVADLIGISIAELDELASVYNLIYRKPVGQNVILLCDSISCWIMGRDAVECAIKQQLQIDVGETDQRGQFTLLPIVCLGHCDHAPAMLINAQLYGDVTPDAVKSLIEAKKQRGAECSTL
jgi:NADH-quinone oxidoreductase subunit E